MPASAVPIATLKASARNNHMTTWGGARLLRPASDGRSGQTNTASSALSAVCSSQLQPAPPTVSFCRGRFSLPVA
jgi:hypothetical protein